MTANQWVPWVVPALGIISAYGTQRKKAWGWPALILSMAIMVPYGVLYSDQDGFILYAVLGVMATINVVHYRRERGSTPERVTLDSIMDPERQYFRIEVVIPLDIGPDSALQRDELFARIADVAHDWEPDERNEWDVFVAGHSFYLEEL